MKKAVLAIVLMFASGCISTDVSSNKGVEKLPPYELILDIRTDRFHSATPENPNRLKIAVRNLGHSMLSSEECFQILFNGTLHVRRPDGRNDTFSLGRWRVSAPQAISYGQMAMHPNNAPPTDYFEMKMSGRYLIWWTSGKSRSNVFVFDVQDGSMKRVE